ncbi:transglutaminase domain-containing protein [Caproiciproducens sp. LBM24188]
MKLFYHKKSMRTTAVGLLAAVVVSLPLSGCQGNPLSGLISSAMPSSGATSSIGQAVASQAASKVTSAASAAVSAASKAVSAASTLKSAASKASSVATVQQKPKTPVKKSSSTKVETGNQNLKKIAIDPNAQTGKQLSISQSKPSVSSYSYVDQRSGYNALKDTPSQNLYKMILASAYEISTQANEQGYYPTARIQLGKVHLSETQIRIALMAALNDNPQVFWLANAYSYGYGGSDTFVQLYSMVSPSACNTMISQLNQKVSSIINSMPSGLNELDRELYLSDYLEQHLTYNTAAAADTSLWKAFNAYGALVEGSVVCEGYSRSMQLLSSYAGLTCILITGQSDGVNHMWNVMRINGSWYHLDNTWDDNNPTIYNYFNVTDAVIRKTHSIFPSAYSLSEAQINGTATGTPAGFNLVIPTCTATAANYFRAKGIPVSTESNTDSSAVVSAIISAANAKKESISFYVTDDADYTQVMNGMLKTSPYRLSDYLNQANASKSLKNKISLRSIRYLQDPDNRGLTVFLTYS